MSDQPPSDRQRAIDAFREYASLQPVGVGSEDTVDTVAAALGITFDADGNIDASFQVTIDDFPGALRWTISQDGQLIDRIYGGRLPQIVPPGTYSLIRRVTIPR